MATELERKKSFFHKLYAPNFEAPYEESGEESVRTFLQNRPHPPTCKRISSPTSGGTIQTIRTPLILSKVPDLKRSISAPPSSGDSSTIIKETPPLARQRLRVDYKDNPLIQEVTCIEETPVLVRNNQSTRSFSSPVEMKKSTTKLTGNSKRLGKRKRDSLILVSEARQIFKGLKFFYLPNDDVAPVRRARITKAREYGALWMRVYNDDVTHIIVDESLTYGDVVKFLKLSSTPRAIMVNENFPIECIQIGGLLDHEQKPYLVSGYPQAVKIPLEQPSPQVNTPNAPSEPLPIKHPPSKSGQLASSSPNTAPSQAPLSEQSNHLSTSEAHRTPAIENRDILDEIIQETKRLEHFLPDLEDEEEMYQMAEEPDDDDNGHSSADEVSNAPRKKKKSSDLSWQENFSCMKGGTGESMADNPNIGTINILQEMANYYDRMNDTWRVMAYRKAITSLKRQTTKVTTYDEAVSLPFIGSRLAEKIEEIVRTNRLRRLDNTKLEPTDHILQQFMNIYGVAYAHAMKWLAQGYRTFSDLLEKANLTDSQRLGISRYDDFLTRIPRAEIEALGDIIKETARGIDSKVNVIIGGSYRRGAKDSGDIDLLITKPGVDTAGLHPLLTELISVLTKKSFLVAALSVSRSETGSKWHGCCVLPGQEKPVWRRIDFLLVGDCELGAALIYFTGNDIFNRSIRLLASRKGMRLNQRGLYKNVIRGPGREKLNEGILIEGKDEERIFEILGVPWRKPEDRIC